MADTSLTPIYQNYTVDISSNNNFIQIPSVQGDGNYVRFIDVILVSNNIQYKVPAEKVNAYIVGTKPDTKHILNNCEIIDGKIRFEITSQMNAVPGRGDYQLMLIDLETNSQLKSFPFYLITTKSYNAEEIMSSDEYQALAHALVEIQDDIDRCEENANRAQASAEAAAISEANALASENAAKASEEAALVSETAAAESAANAKDSETASEQYATDAENYADLARKWAVWEDGEQTPDAENNAYYWAQKAKEWGDHDASNLTYTKEDGTKVILSDFIKIIEDLEDDTILVI